MKQRREEFEDDGRTIADMSGVSRPSLWGHHPAPERAAAARPQPEDEPLFHSEQKEPIPPEDRVWYALGALKAALLIALAFIVGLGLTIAVLLLIWRGL